MEKRRCIRMDAVTKNMLIYALGDLYREEKERGGDMVLTRALALKLAGHTDHRLYLSDAEYKKAVEALNDLRDNYIEAGRYADGINEVMLKVVNAKYKRCAVR